MFNFISVRYVIFVLNVCLINAQISDKRLCANEDCTEPISRAKTLMRYGSNDHRILSFAPNEDVIIYSKSAGSRMDLWGAEIKGKRGYVPISHLREYKTLTKSLNYLIDTEDNKSKSPQVPSKNEPTKVVETPAPDPVQQSYEVVDGTTIYLNPEEINPTTTESPAQATVVPSQQDTQPLSSGKDGKHERPVEVAKDERKDATETNKITGETEKVSEDVKSDKDGSIVGNVFSKFSNWMGEDNGESVEEDEYEDEEEDVDVDGAVEDENEEEEGEEEEDDETTKNLKQNVQENLNKEDKLNVKEAKTSEEIKAVPETTIPEDTLSAKENATNEEIPDKDEIKENLEEAKVIVQQVDVNQIPISLGEQGVHSSFTTEEANYEVPLPNTEEVTPNPFEAVIPDKEISEQTVVQEKLEETTVTEGKLEENLIEEESLQDVTIENTNLPSNEQNVMTDSDDSPNKLNEPSGDVIIPDSSEKLEIGSESIDDNSATNGDRVDDFLLPSSDISSEKLETNVDNTEKLEDTAQTILTNSSEDTPTQTENGSDQSVQEKGPETQQADEPLTNAVESEESTENPEKLSAESVDEEQAKIEETFEDHQTVEKQTSEDKQATEPDNSSGLFSGLYSSVFGSPENESETVDNQPVPNEHSEIPYPNTPEIMNPETHSMVPDSLASETLNLETQTNPDELEADSTELPTQSNEPTSELNEIRPETAEESARNILWGSSIRKNIENRAENHEHERLDDLSCDADPLKDSCPFASQSEHQTQDAAKNINIFDVEFPLIAYEVFIVLVITAVTIVVFLWGYMVIDKSRKEASLIAKINTLEKKYLIEKKENELLCERLSEVEGDVRNKADKYSSELVEGLQQELAEVQQARASLEEQVQTLEKELENSTEVGLELNRMLSEFLSSENGSETVIANIEQLQRQLVEQQGTINTYNENLAMKETENHELRLELEINNTKVTELQSELNKMALNLLKVEEDKDQTQSSCESEIGSLKERIEKSSSSFKSELAKISDELKNVKQKYEEAQRNLNIKTNEYSLLKETVSQVEKVNNNSEALQSIFDISSVKAELLQLRNDKELLIGQLQDENESKCTFEKQARLAIDEAQSLRMKYDEADREKLEAQTKLQVLSNYFKDREAQLQKELSKQESMWIEKEGEATSTIERIKYMQEELQNYKAQYESLKQELLSQEVQMKSQISVLEKKAHENWVSARQAERKLDDAKQEAAQLRNRLTLRERSFADEKMQNRLQSPIEQNGELPVSPLHLPNDTAASPPLLYGARDHLTTSPPLPGLAPFLLPPPGVPFMPPPLGGVHMPPPGFIPPPPIPGDHRPPPLGRMSSPPLNSRYSPDLMAYSPYSRNSPSPTSDDDYGRSSPPHLYRAYSPYSRGDERRDFNRPPPPIRSNPRNNKGVTHSSGSANSNESLEKINRHNSKV